MLKLQLIYVLGVLVILCGVSLCDGDLFECSEEITYLQPNCALLYYNISQKIDFNIEVDEYDYVSYLSFLNSNVEYIPYGIFVELPNVIRLQVSDSNLLEITGDEFESSTSLAYLHLANNSLTRLSDSIFVGAHNLILINLAYNRISYIHENAFKSLSKLKNLNLSYNQIVIISNNLFAHFTDIAYIDLSQNSIVSFVDSFGTYELSLEQLNLNFNQITNISLSSNVAINELTIINNKLMAINLNRNSVKILRADNNKLQSTGLSISDCDLTKLSLKNNSLLDFNFIRNMSNLTQLDLSFNTGGGRTITNDTFAKLSNLISLRLEAVTLQQLDFQMFSQLLHLQVLDISYNDLKSINFHMLSLLENLKRLYINGNSLTNITLTEFEFLFPNLKEIDISDNNWQCDRLVDILRKLQQLNIKSTIEPERLVKNERNIRGIRCNENSSDPINVTKIPFVRVQHNDDIEMIALRLNQTQSKLNEFEFQNENNKIKLTQLLHGLNSDRNRTTYEMNQTKSRLNVFQQRTENITEFLNQLNLDNHRNLQNQIDQIKIKLDELLDTQSAKLLLPQENNIDDPDGNGADLTTDIKFVKIILIIFLISGFCVLGVKCYRFYFKKSSVPISFTHRQTNIAENNL